MSIYTRRGDDFTTDTIYDMRQSKHSAIVSCYGELDSLNAQIGFAASFIEDRRLVDMLNREQRHLFVLPMLICEKCKSKSILAENRNIVANNTAQLETEIDEINQQLPRQSDFILPTGTPAVAAVHLARTKCRDTERVLSAATEYCYISNEAKAYINRLSDWLFIIARLLNKISNNEEKTLHNSSEIIN